MLFSANKENVNADTQKNVVQNQVFDEDEIDIFAWKKPEVPAIIQAPLTQADLDPFYEPGCKDHSYDLQYVRDLNRDLTICAAEQGDNVSLSRWNGSYWVQLTEKEALRKAWNWLTQNATKKATASNAASLHASALLGVKKLPSTPKVSIVPLEDCWLIVGNDGEFVAKKPDPAWGITYQINARLHLSDAEKHYQPEPLPADSYFSRFLALSLPDEQERMLVQEYCGYTLLNDVRFQVSQVWVGDGCNGKSVLLKIIERLHAKVGSIRLDALSGFGLAPLVDASLLICSEAPRRGIDEQTFKQIVSGDPVTVEYKFKDMFMYSPKAKLLVACNRFPHFSDDTNGVWRRVQIVRWGVNLTKEQQIANLEQLIIDTELKHVVDWCLEGLARLLKRGDFNEPPSVRSRKDAEKTNSNNVLAFVADSNLGISVVGDLVLKEKVYEKYANYCSAHGLTAFHGTEFWKRMGQIFPYMQERRKSVGGGRPRAVNLEFGQQQVQAVAQVNDNPFNEQ